MRIIGDYDFHNSAVNPRRKVLWALITHCNRLADILSTRGPQDRIEQKGTEGITVLPDLMLASTTDELMIMVRPQFLSLVISPATGCARWKLRRTRYLLLASMEPKLVLTSNPNLDTGERASVAR
jgi:hypothetical protein